jgi:hypothetical protein
MSSIAYNDMPGELKDRIKLWEMLNRILLNNGYVNVDAITADLASLKTQLNSLLSEVLGVEHDIDGIHNYEQQSLKKDIDNIKEQITLTASDIAILTAKVIGYTHTPSQTVVSMMTDNIGSRLVMTQNQVALQSADENTISQIAVGGPNDISGIDIASDNIISISNRALQHYIHVKDNITEISDVNGIKITAETNGVRFTNADGSKNVLLTYPA